MTDAATNAELAGLRRGLFIAACVSWAVAVAVLIGYLVAGFDLLGLIIPAAFVILGFNMIVWRSMSITISRMATTRLKVALAVGTGSLMAGMSVVGVFVLTLAAFYALALTGL